MFGMHDMRALTPPPDSSEVAEMPVHKTAAVSYTHLTLPTNREV